MEGIILLISIFAMVLVPVCLLITIQYCVHIGKDSGSVELMVFSMFSALIIMPFSILVSVSILLSFISVGEEYLIEKSSFLIVDLGYIVLGWLVCSALYGELIVPKFSQREIKLP